MRRRGWRRFNAVQITQHVLGPGHVKMREGERMLQAVNDLTGEDASVGSENSVPIGVFIVHRYRSALWGLERLVDSAKPSMQVVGGATTLAEALAYLETAKPDVILLELNIDNEIGLDAIPRVMARSPAKILMFAGVREKTLREAAILKGARGLVEKEGDGETILNAIRKVHAGEVWLDRVSAGRVFAEFSRMLADQAANPELPKISMLTAREREIVAVAAAHPGATARENAEKLHISEHTMRNHLNAIYEKLGVGNRVELYAYAQKYGITGRPAS